MDERNLPDINETVFTDRIKQAIELIPHEYLCLTEKEIRGKLKPTLMLYEIRQAFWEEVAFAHEAKTRIRVGRIYEGKCSRDYFYRCVVPNQLRMAWISSPLVAYEDKARAVLEKVSERYEELIEMEITTMKKRKDPDTGEWIHYTETCPKKALVLLQTIKNLEDRVKGTAIQRQVAVNANAPDVKKGESVSVDMSKLDDKIKELESKLNPEPVVVEVEKV